MSSGSGARLAVDANGRFDLARALAYAAALEAYGLFWYEEAGDPLDFELQATLATRTDRRSPRARTSSHVRTSATSCATAGCARTAT